VRGLYQNSANSDRGPTLKSLWCVGVLPCQDYHTTLPRNGWFTNHSKSFIHFSNVICAFTNHIVELVFVLSYIRCHVWGSIESAQSKPHTLGEAYLKVGSSGWWALLNSNLVLNCASSSRCFSCQYCKIESMCLIGLGKVFDSWLSSEQDGVLLKIRNRMKKVVCGVSLLQPVVSWP
jgi:hypothetical protein